MSCLLCVLIDGSTVVGGPAGCVVAGRLAKADPNLQVMLIEYGQNNIDVRLPIS
jgi:alcohol oxidase